jgi:hypothetical protein
MSAVKAIHRPRRLTPLCRRLTWHLNAPKCMFWLSSQRVYLFGKNASQGDASMKGVVSDALPI